MTVPAAGQGGLAGVLDLLEAMRRTAGRRLWIALGFLLLGSLTEGATILLLLPILHLTGAGAPDYTIALGGRSIGGIPLPDISLGLGPMLAGVVVLVALQAVFNRRKALYLSDLLTDFANVTRTEMFRAVTQTRWDALVRLRMSDLEHMLTGEIERIQQAGFLALSILQGAIGMVIFLLLSLLISVPMTAFAFGFGCLALLLLHPYRRLARQFGERIQARRAEQFAIVSQFLGGLKTARILNQEPRYLREFGANLATDRIDMAAYVRRNATGAGLFQIALAAGAALFVHLGLRVVGLGVTEIIVLLLVLMRVAPRFLALQSQAQQFLMDFPAYRRVRALHMTLLASAEEAAPEIAIMLARPRMSITLDRVTYRYGDAPDAAAALADCTIRIKVGEVTALIGPSGSGKSTVADILTGLISPETGQLAVDGRVIAGAALRQWRKHIAYVPQETFLLHGTIRDNLIAGASTVPEPDIFAALSQAAALDFVQALPQGLDTVVGDRGTLLSGGERQRIALARAFLAKPALLILDEATSALDWQSQARVASALAAMAGRITVLTIAHRPSMVAFADTVYAMQAGRVVEQGRTADLVNDSRSHLSRMLRHELQASH
ncbi:MAG: ABC transporter ATP-binding protein [Rhodobacterales bacterium]|nr:ABC transporter ATP-binding protein [Rhodobacterales bacterium]